MCYRARIETFDHTGAGYSPLLIRPGWQVARLNFMQDLTAGAIRRVERHNHTDEVFVLFKGSAMLIAAEETGSGWAFQVRRMEQCVTYNIPAGVWHAIAMTPNAVVIIVENHNTHLNDVTYRDLDTTQYTSLQTAIKTPEQLK